jgi:N-acetylglucosamine-6-phosphate deacetylase
VNGFLGVDFSAPGLKEDDVARVSSELARRGTGAFCPTVVTSSLEVYEENLPVLARATEEELPARILGIHLEGPFISPAEGARGAHPREHCRAPDPALLERLLELARGRAALLTLAPELEGACPLVERATRSGLAVGIGHTLAGPDEIARAVEAGARFSTHLGNGLPSSVDRHSNPLWPQLAEDRLAGLFITDGHHLPAEFTRTALRAKGARGFVVTSDSSSVAGLPPGEYEALGARVVLEPAGRLGLAGTRYLAGSSACMLDCMNHLASLGELDEAGLAAVGRTNALALAGARGEDARAARVRVRYGEGAFTVEGG